MVNGHIYGAISIKVYLFLSNFDNVRKKQGMVRESDDHIFLVMGTITIKPNLWPFL